MPCPAELRYSVIGQGRDIGTHPVSKAGFGKAEVQLHHSAIACVNLFGKGSN